MKIEKGKMIKKIIIKCIYSIIIICILYNIIFSINTTIFEKDYLKLFGISLFNMDNDLMQDDINKGDLVIIKEGDSKDLQKGDIIAYNINGKTRINKIFRKEQEQYVTKSNKNYNPDIEKITEEQIIGKKVANISSLGRLIVILQSKTTTFGILIFLILHFSYNKYLNDKKIERANKKAKKGTGS